MSASTSDKFQKLGGTSSLVNTPRVTSTRSGGGTTLAVDNCNWDQTTGKTFATYQVNTSGVVVDGTQIIWRGIVTGTTSIGSLTRLSGASDTGSAIGDYVELLPASLWGNAMVDGLLAEHTNPNGYHALTTNATLTSSKFITDLSDTNGNELFKVSPTASAVNEFTVANAAIGNAPNLSATGGDTNIDLKITPKGTGRVVINGAGAPQTATVATSETTATTSYTDLTTVTDTVTVTIGASGLALVIVSCEQTNNTNGGQNYMSYAASGNNTIAASDTRSLFSKVLGGIGDNQGSYMRLHTGLTAGSTVFKAKYRVGGGTGTFVNREITVIPL